MHVDQELSLLEEARKGSEEAFCQIVFLHQSKVRSYLGRYLRDRDAVYDLAQDTFLRVYRNLAAFKGDSTVSLWILGIARNVLREYLRKVLQRPLGQKVSMERALLSWSAQRLEAEAPGTGPREAKLEALRRCVEGLGEHGSALVQEYYFRGRAAGEIGRQIGKTEGAVWMLLLRLRNALRDCVKARLAGQGAL